MVTRSRDFSLALAVLHAFDMASLALQHKKGQGVFHSAALKDCLFVVQVTLSCFFVFGAFSVSGSLVALRASTGDTLRLRQRRAAGRLQTDISHAARDFSLARSLFCTQYRRGVARVAT